MNCFLVREAGGLFQLQSTLFPVQSRRDEEIHIHRIGVVEVDGVVQLRVLLRPGTRAAPKGVVGRAEGLVVQVPAAGSTSTCPCGPVCRGAHSAARVRSSQRTPGLAVGCTGAVSISACYRRSNTPAPWIQAAC